MIALSFLPALFVHTLTRNAMKADKEEVDQKIIMTAKMIGELVESSYDQIKKVNTKVEKLSSKISEQERMAAHYQASQSRLKINELKKSRLKSREPIIPKTERIEKKTPIKEDEDNNK